MINAIEIGFLTLEDHMSDKKRMENVCLILVSFERSNPR